MCCYDSFTGNKLWYKEFPHNLGNMILLDNQAITTQNNLTESFLISLNIQNGNSNWKIPINQHLAQLRYLNEIVYFVSSSDSKLHAYDSTNGKELWRINAPDDAGFKPECTVIPGKDGAKGKVIVSSYLSAFCYEAIK
jgi:outer membrane protein assembly factor BamB